MSRNRRFAAIYVLLCTLGIGSLALEGCGHNPPILTPGAATALTNGLTALSAVLRAQNVSPLILAAISDAQTAIAQDVSGASWGQIVRQLLTELYTQLPGDILTKAWPVFAAVEIILVTIGA